DYLELLSFVDTEALIDHVDPVQYTIRLLIPPGSLLLSRPAIRPFLGGLDAAAFTYRWTHPDPRMDELPRAASALGQRAASPREGGMGLGDIRLQLGVRVHPNRGHEAVACERFRAIPQSLVDAGSLQRPNRVIQRRGRWPDLPVQHARCLALTAAGLEQLGPSE